LADPELSRRLGDAGRARARQELSADVMVDRLVQMYHAVLGTEEGAASDIAQ
jgi:hypothetical protein